MHIVRAAAGRTACIRKITYFQYVHKKALNRQTGLGRQEQQNASFLGLF